MCYAVQGESEGKRGREREMAEKSLRQRCKERVLMGLMARLRSRQDGELVRKQRKCHHASAYQEALVMIQEDPFEFKIQKIMELN